MLLWADLPHGCAWGRWVFQSHREVQTGEIKSQHFSCLNRTMWSRLLEPNHCKFTGSALPLSCHNFQPPLASLPAPAPAVAGGSWGRSQRGKAVLSFHFLSALRCGFAGSRDEEALADAQQPVQALPGAVDEDSQRVPALFCPLHQAQ